MSIKSIRLEHKNPLATDYKKGLLDRFFDYKPFGSLEERTESLKSRKFPREELVTILKDLNQKWGASDKTLRQIERLGDKNSVVVIGGQQAGLLTGPLYTIHKVISIIKFAREQEEKLGVPVIPMFWIAGEDHDFDEINHVYTVTNNQLNKRPIKQEEWRKKSVSHLKLDQSVTEKWIKQVFHDLVETEHTRSLSEKIFHHLRHSSTYVDFFAKLLLDFFYDEGIVLIDSANEQLRYMESPYFEKMIINQQKITASVYRTAEKIRYLGYTVQVDVTETDGNLFYHDENGERILLYREGENWIGKNKEVSFSEAELLKIAQREPYRLSNNVMTRPLMQEAILPTLAFIAGDGEISYWALLKNAFRNFDSTINMPPVVPRLSLTLVTERVDKLINNRHLNASYIVNHGCKKLSTNWLTTQYEPPIDLIYGEVKDAIGEIHEPIQNLAESIAPDLANEAKRNLQNILKEIEYIELRTKQKLHQKFALTLNQFKEINVALRPKNELQERVLNIIPILNECGFDFIRELIKANFSFEKEHYLVYLHKLKR